MIGVSCVCVCVWGGGVYHTHLLKCVLRKKDQNRKSVVPEEEGNKEIEVSGVGEGGTLEVGEWEGE